MKHFYPQSPFGALEGLSPEQVFLGEAADPCPQLAPQLKHHKIGSQPQSTHSLSDTFCLVKHYLSLGDKNCSTWYIGEGKSGGNIAGRAEVHFDSQPMNNPNAKATGTNAARLMTFLLRLAILSMEKEPVTLQEAVVYFFDLARCREYLVARRWPDGIQCPHIRQKLTR